MTWVVIALSLGCVIGSLVFAMLWRRRTRRVRIVSPSHAGAVHAPSGVYGLQSADLAALRHADDSGRAGWRRDYATNIGDTLPGRVGGIPRGLRIKS